MMWTRESLLEQVTNSPRITDDEERWKRVWTRPVGEFDLTFHMATPEVPYHMWDEDMFRRMQGSFVRLNNVCFTTQTVVRLDVLAWYLSDPIAKKENFDTEGWMGNDHPVMILLPSGAYAIRDGHHRVISRMLTGRQFAYVYVMKGK